MDSFFKFRNCLLDTFRRCNEKDEYCELEVHCSDGKLSIQGLVFAFLCSYIDRKEISSVEDHCLVLPDISAEDLLTFLRCLFAADAADWDGRLIARLVHVSRIIGVAAEGITNFNPPPTPPPPPSPAPNANQLSVRKEQKKRPHRPRIVTTSSSKAAAVNSTTPASSGAGILYSEELSGLSSLFLEGDRGVAVGDGGGTSASACANGGGGISDKKCHLKLAEISIDTVTDDVLTENFCDQDGRLVCLVCYKIMGPSDFAIYRAHIKAHEPRQLEKVTISLPEVGRGGPGLRKNPTSDSDLEAAYLEPDSGRLACKKCGKTYRLEEKASFRKHLNYHAHKEKNYVYVCSKCSKTFSDPSNFKRHVHSVHEKQVFRCLHCDFEDKKKKKLEDHLMQVHQERDIAHSKGGAQEPIADLSSGDPIPSFHHSQESGRCQPEPSHSPSRVFCYKCSECNFKTRREEEAETHIKESHVNNQEQPTTATVKRIALKPRETRYRVHVCPACNEVFKKRALLNQHLLRVHGLDQQQEGTGADFACAQCNIQCASMSGLRAHERAHLEKKFSCGTCAKSFLRLNLLRDHLARQTCLVETRTCHICHKVFSDRIRKEIHLKTHFNDKAFACTVCGKAFVQKRSLKEHMLTHETVRHYACAACGKQFVQANHLRYHLASQHPDFPVGGSEGSDPAAAGVTPFRRHNCAHCAKTFPFAYQLKRHQRVHGLLTGGGINDVKASLQCVDCLNWFASPTLLREHREQACFVLTYDANVDQTEPAAANNIEVILASEEAEEVPAAVDDPDENFVGSDSRWDEGEIIVTSEDLEVVGEDSLSQMEVNPV